MKKKPDFLWYKLNKRGEERFRSIKETIQNYNPAVERSEWVRARRKMIRDIAPPKVFTATVEIAGHTYNFSQKLHFDAYETNWVRNKGYVTKARKSRGLL